MYCSFSSGLKEERKVKLADTLFSQEMALRMQVAITCSNAEKAPNWQQLNDIQRGDEIIGKAVYTIDARGLALQVSLLKQAPVYVWEVADKCG